ncbi:hypothetical protein [Nonomuraea sp. NPDC049504]|uniref:ABC transporter substrate-binding protein n=1 Tax=Nonomuraea sp. NPDC049504 TaxID=3154729 RepID=UPI0034436B4D
MAYAPAYPLIVDAVRRPSPLAREDGRPILVFTGDLRAADEAVDDVDKVGRWAPHARIEATAASDVAGVIEKLTFRDGLLTRWVGGTLLPPPRFLLTRFILWAWREAHPAASGEHRETPTREDYARSHAAWRKAETFTGPALRSWADYVSRTMTTWLPASGLTAFGLQQFMDGVNLLLWLISPAVAVVLALLHATLLVRGLLSYRWFRRAPYLPRRAGEPLIDYAMRIAGTELPPGHEDEHGEQAERLLVAALLEDLRQAYRRRLFPWAWPGWGRHTYPVVGIKHADPGTAGRRFVELVEEIRVGTGQRGPLLLVVSTSVPPPAHHARFDGGGIDAPAELYAEWGRAMRRFQPSPYLVIDTTRPVEPGTVRRRPERRLHPVRAMVFWAFVLTLVAAPVTVTAANALGCGSGLHELADQCVGMGSLDKITPHATLRPVTEKIEQQNAAIPFGAKVIKVAYLGPLTTQPGAQFKDGQMTAVAGELTGLGAYQAEFNKSKSDWKMKVLFANTGQDFLGAELAAGEIAGHAKNDPSLAAVVGFAWSRDEVRRAITRLTKVDMPMVGTVSTVHQIAVDDKGRRSPYFYRLAVVDTLQVKATVHWLEQIGLDPEVGTRPEVAVVWQNQPGELYSKDLRDLFWAAYQGEKTEHSFTDDASLEAAVRKACRTKAKVLYYTGRADFLAIVQRSWGTACQRRGVRLLASDDVTGAIANDVHSNPGKHTVTMSFVSLTDARNPSDNQSQEVLWRWADKTSKTFSYVHAAFAYDAVQAVAMAFNTYRDQSPDALAVRAGVHYNLRGLSFDGATGAVAFSSDATDHDAQGRAIWLMTVEAGEEIKAVRECHPTAKTHGCGQSRDPGDTT